MNIMYYVMSAVLMGIAFCLGALTEKHFADEEIKMLKTRKMRPARAKKPVDFPETRKIER